MVDYSEELTQLTTEYNDHYFSEDELNICWDIWLVLQQVLKGETLTHTETLILKRGGELLKFWVEFNDVDPHADPFVEDESF